MVTAICAGVNYNLAADTHSAPFRYAIRLSVFARKCADICGSRAWRKPCAHKQLGAAAVLGGVGAFGVCVGVGLGAALWKAVACRESRGVLSRGEAAVPLRERGRCSGRRRAERLGLARAVFGREAEPLARRTAHGWRPVF